MIQRPARLPAFVFAWTFLAMSAFAANSLLCRMALRQGGIDATSFSSIRLVAGALMLAVIVRVRGGPRSTGGNWPSAVMLFIYAVAFSWAYVSLPTATGALLLFGAVQITMVSVGLWRGERMRPLQAAGLSAACAGLVAMLLPGVQTPPPGSALLMMGAGVAWGVYSLRGRGAGDPTAVTAGNFARASVLAVVCSVALLSSATLDPVGVVGAITSGALASGVGYAVWYRALRDLSASAAAAVQLTVPVIAAIGAIALLGEPLGWRLALSGMVVLGGVAMVVVTPHRA